MLEWILSSTVLTAIVIVLRYLFKGKISLRLQYALWGLVLLRLLIPLSFGSTGMSVQNLVDRPAAQAPQVSNPVEREAQGVEPGSVVLENPVSNVQAQPAEDRNAGQSRQGELPQTIAADNRNVGGDVQTAASTEAQHLSVTEILTIVWLSGAGMIALWLLIANVQFYFKLRKSRGLLDVDDAPLPVYVTDKIDTPCLFGMVKPKIYVTPEVAEDETTLRYSIAHEATHYRHGDHIWSILRGLCLALHWYNPLVWVAAILSRNDAELACDEATIRRLGEEHRAEYGRTLVELTCQKRSAIFVAATTMTGSGRSIKERIKLIVKKPKTAVYTLIAILLVIAIAVGCTFTGAKPEDAGSADTDATEEATTPTGNDDGEVQFVYVRHDGVLYTPTYLDDDCIPDGAAYAEKHNLVQLGKTVSESNDTLPEDELDASRLPVGTTVYLGKQPNTLYVLREDGVLLLCRPYQEPVSPTESNSGLKASDLSALLDAIDPPEATLTFQVASFPADGAMRAADYLEALKTQFSWVENWTDRPDSTDDLGPFVQLSTPDATFTCYQSGSNVHVETESAEGWFLPQVLRYDADMQTSVYGKVLSWYIEAEAASLYGGNARILTEEEVESFRAFTASSYETYDQQSNLTSLFTTEISCFFTSHYMNVRDIDAYAFLKYFPKDPNAPEVDEAEWDLVQEVEDWRFGEDNHLVTLDWLPVPVHRIPRARVNEALMKYAGITVEEMNTSWFEEVTYVPATDSFYTYTSDAGPGQFFPWFGIEMGDRVALWEKPGRSSALPLRLDLKKNGDGWQILSFDVDGYEAMETKEEMIDGNRAYLDNRLEHYGYGSDEVQYDVLHDMSGRRAYLFAASDRGYVICKYSSMRCIEHGEGNPYGEYMDCEKYFEGVSHYGVVLPDNSFVYITSDH